MNDEITLVIDNSQARLQKEGETLVLRIGGEPLQRVPLNLLGLVVVYGNPQVPCTVWRILNERNIPSIIFPSRGKSPPVFLSPGLSSTITLRLKQYQARKNPENATATAKWLLFQKISALEALLDRYQDGVNILGEGIDPPKPPSDLNQTSLGVREILKSSARSIEEHETGDGLMGFEGVAAAAWFGFLARHLPSKWNFRGRNRRPPLDPLNSLLSLGYTLLYAEMSRQVFLRGLDPYLGFIHAPKNGRESLVLDFMEPLRPAVDAFALQLLASDLAPSHFNNSNRDGCRLTKVGRALFYGAWASFRLEWPDFGGILTGVNEGVEPEKEGENMEGMEVVVGENRLRRFCQAIMRQSISLWPEIDGSQEDEHG